MVYSYSRYFGALAVITVQHLRQNKSKNLPTTLKSELGVRKAIKHSVLKQILPTFHHSPSQSWLIIKAIHVLGMGPFPPPPCLAVPVLPPGYPSPSQ